MIENTKVDLVHFNKEQFESVVFGIDEFADLKFVRDIATVPGKTHEALYFLEEILS